MMYRFQLVFITLAMSCSIAMGQTFSKEFGKIEKDEIELKEYGLDKDAEAVVLFDKGKSYFVRSDNSFDVIFERTTRIKILSEAGVKWAEVEIPFYQEGNIYEKVFEIEASSYNFDNNGLKTSTFDPSDTYDEKINEYWNIKRFAVPNVKVGSIIEYRYKISSQYKFNFRDWEFQWKIPVVYSEYTAKMIPFYEYNFILQGANKFDIYDSYKDKGLPRHFGSPGAYGDNTYYDMVYKFGMKNVPAFGDEEFISSINDYIMKIDFQLAKIHNLDGTELEIITTWEDLIKELSKDKDFGKFINKTERLSSKVLNTKEIIKKPDNEKFNTILDYVKNNYNWNNYYGKYASKNPKDLVKDKIGNCADINLFTVGLLNSIGIESYPVILSTRNHGKIKGSYPFSHFFNYVIVLAYVDGNIMLADGTEILSKNNRIPERCINDKGLVVKEDQVNWISLESLFTSNIETYMHVDINENTVKVDVLKTGTEYDALFFRNKYAGKMDNLKQMISSNSYSIIDSSIKIQNYLDKTKPYRLRYSLTTKPELVNNKIYISPLQQESISDNPLKQRERKYPIDMVYPKKRVFNSTLLIPEGYAIDFIPKDLKINNELFELNYSVKEYTDKLQVTFDYYFKKPIYKSNDYSKIKFYLNEVVKKGNEKVVLKKLELANKP